ncbi:MAG: hypothetical protein LWW93_15360 [Hyphomicrobiales bacterium]|nr:hypothetical protein [Hyphomicrobiales bacterium]
MIDTSKRRHRSDTKTLNITITPAEIERIDRYVARIKAANPRLKPSRSLVIAEALAQLVDDRRPIWSWLDD